MRRGQRRVDKIFNPYTGEMMGERVPREPPSIEAVGKPPRQPSRRSARAVCKRRRCCCADHHLRLWSTGLVAACRGRGAGVCRHDRRHVAPDGLERAQRGRLLDVPGAVHVGAERRVPGVSDGVRHDRRRARSNRSPGSAVRGVYRGLAWMSDAHFGRFAGNGVKVCGWCSDSLQRSCSRPVSLSGGLASRRDDSRPSPASHERGVAQAAARAAGRAIVTRRPGWAFSTVHVPRWISTARRAIASPSPIPPVEESLNRSTR